MNLNKGLELPLEQASRLLEEHDFQDVLNKIPDDTFDMFSGIIHCFVDDMLHYWGGMGRGGGGISNFSEQKQFSAIHDLQV